MRTTPKWPRCLLADADCLLSCAPCHRGALRRHGDGGVKAARHRVGAGATAKSAVKGKGKGLKAAWQRAMQPGLLSGGFDVWCWDVAFKPYELADILAQPAA